MLQSSFTHALTMRCDIERRTEDADGWGHSSDFKAVSQRVRCYWWVRTGNERISDDRSVSVANETVVFDYSADVKTGDRITNVTDHVGRVIFDNFREIEHVANRRNHLEATLRSSS